MYGRSPRATSSPATAGRAVTPVAASVLGADHPLSQAIERLNALRRQAATTAAAVGCGIVAVIQDVPGAEFALGAGAAVLVGLCIVALLQRQTRDERARDLIIEGREDLPLPEITTLSRTLSSARHRERLAGTLKRALDDAERWAPSSGILWPPWANCDLRCVAEPIRDIVVQVRADGAGVRGVALLDRLLAGQSPAALDARELREELGRIRYLLRCTGG
jgi:hypothetical protein